MLPRGMYVSDNSFTGALDCKLSSWSSWSECPAGCGNAKQERIRKVTRAEFNGGRCWALNQTRPCLQFGCRKCFDLIVESSRGNFSVIAQPKIAWFRIGVCGQRAVKRVVPGPNKKHER
jgi:hypothetical protein